MAVENNLSKAERDALVESHVGIARKVAAKEFASGGFGDTQIEDVVQEALIGLVWASRAYDPTRGIKFTTYGWRCARCEVRTMRSRIMRKRSRSPKRDGEFKVGLIQAKSDISETRLRLTETAERMPYLHDRVWRIARDALAPRSYAMIRYAADGMTYRQIADVLGVTAGTVSTDLARSRATLRDQKREEILEVMAA